MPHEAFFDKVENLSLVERLGVIRSLTRKVRVILDPDLRAANYSALSDALDHLGTLGIIPMSRLLEFNYESLVLVERNPSIAENDPCCVDVILKYEHFLDGPNQIIRDPTPPVLYGKGRASIVERSTNFFYPPGVPRTLDNREQITVAHTFGHNETDVVGAFFDNDNNPRTVLQGGEITVPFPQTNWSVEGVTRAGVNPFNVEDAFIARTNDRVWLTKPINTWLCTEVRWQAEDIFIGRYRFSFEFQNNQDGWDPTVTFNDQRTGRPPANVQPAIIVGPNGVQNLTLCTLAPFSLQPAGYWQVPVSRQANFAELFGSFFEGLVP